MLLLPRKSELTEATEQVVSVLRPLWEVEVIVTQAIGCRYRRRDGYPRRPNTSQRKRRGTTSRKLSKPYPPSLDTSTPEGILEV